MSDLKPCPNPECSGGRLRMDERGVPNEDFMFIWCEGCGTQGPSAQKYSESQRLWNALPRQDGLRGALEKIISWRETTGVGPTRLLLAIDKVARAALAESEK